MQTSGSDFDCRARLQCFRQWMALDLLSQRCGFRSPTKALRRILLAGPGMPPLTRPTRVRIPHATLLSLPTESAPTLRTLVAVVRLHPGTPLELSRSSRSAPRRLPSRPRKTVREIRPTVARKGAQAAEAVASIRVECSRRRIRHCASEARFLLFDSARER